MKNEIEKANKRLFNLLDFQPRFQPDPQIHRLLYRSTDMANFIKLSTEVISLSKGLLWSA